MTGVYESAGEISARLLRALPPLLRVDAGALDSPLVPLLADEIVKDEPGQEAVLDRLLDLLLIATLRAWFAREDAPGWYRAYADPVVGPALRALHDEPARPWTVAELARRGGVSRAALARRFNDLVGEPPMSFLTGWRIALAADLLLEPGATIGSVAAQVGYGSPFALSTAFKRLRGVSPRSSGRLDDQQHAGADRHERAGDRLVGVDELGELDQLLGVRERVVDDQQAARRAARARGPASSSRTRAARRRGTRGRTRRRRTWRGPPRRPACAARRTRRRRPG